MQLVSLDLIRLPNWGWHLDDRQEHARLMASLHKYGQTQALIVREVDAEDVDYELVDGRRRFEIMQQLGHQTAWIWNLGRITKEEAIQHALSLELAAEIDYPRMATLVKSLEGTEAFASLPVSTPFTGERYDYFCKLTEFDWSQYQAGDDQVSLFEGDDDPPPQKKVEKAFAESVAKQPNAMPKAEKRAAVAKAAAQPQAQPAIDVASRLAARAQFQKAAFAIETPAIAVDKETGIALKILDAADMAKPIFPMRTDVVTPAKQIFMGVEAPVENRDWRPPTPPSLDGIKEIELDCETTGLRWWQGDKPIGMSLRLPDGRKFYLPWGHRGGNLDEGIVKEWARRELRGKKITNANIRFDNHMLYAWGVDLEAQDCSLADVAHYAALLDEYRKDFGLDFLARDFLGLHKTGEGLDKNRMADYHASQVADYAMNDVELVGKLKPVMIPLMDAQDLQKVRQLECDVIYPVCEMERNAAHVDRARLLEATKACRVMLDEMLYEISREVGFQVNPDKQADLVKLFDYLKLPYPGRTPPSQTFPQGQPSFADALMSKVDNPTVQLVRKSGKLASLLSKFLTPYSEVVGPDNLLRFALHQLRGDEYGTVRGRFSMSGGDRVLGRFGANLQQVFRVNSQREAFGYAYNDASHDDEIFLVRALFGAAPYTRIDGTLADHLSADAQSIEYRLAAHFAESKPLIEAYQKDAEQLARGDLTSKWVDFHSVVGDRIRKYIDRSRNIIKNANFCLVYGGREGTLTKTLGVAPHEGRQIYQAWHAEFPDLGGLPKKAENLARKRGYVKTISGRRARFTTSEHMQWAHAAINYVIQGSAADIMKQKLVELHRERKWTELLMRYTVHDEVDGDGRHPESAQRVREVLNLQTCKDFDGNDLRVPIVWEVETGANWAVAH